jgi:hypothetical protein
MRGVPCAVVPCVWGRCTWAVEIESKGSGRLWLGASVVVDQESSGSSAISVHLKSWPYVSDPMTTITYRFNVYADFIQALHLRSHDPYLDIPFRRDLFAKEPLSFP